MGEIRINSKWLNPRVSRKVKESNQNYKNNGELNLNVEILKLPLKERLWINTIKKEKNRK